MGDGRSLVWAVKDRKLETKGVIGDGRSFVGAVEDRKLESKDGVIGDGRSLVGAVEDRKLKTKGAVIGDGRSLVGPVKERNMGTNDGVIRNGRSLVGAVKDSKLETKGAVTGDVRSMVGSEGQKTGNKERSYRKWKSLNIISWSNESCRVYERYTYRIAGNEKRTKLENMEEFAERHWLIWWMTATWKGRLKQQKIEMMEDY